MYFDGECGVTLWARNDEWSGQGENFVEAQRHIEWRRKGALIQSRADVRRVTRLNRQDGASGGQIRLGHYVCGSAKISAYRINMIQTRPGEIIYAETPTPSRIEAVARNVLTSVTPNE